MIRRVLFFLTVNILVACGKPGHFIFSYEEIDPDDKVLRFSKTNDFTDGNPFNQLLFDTLKNGIATEVYLFGLDTHKFTPGYYLRNDSIFLTVQSAEVENALQENVCDCLRKYKLKYKLTNLSVDREYKVFFAAYDAKLDSNPHYVK